MIFRGFCRILHLLRERNHCCENSMDSAAFSARMFGFSFGRLRRRSGHTEEEIGAIRQASSRIPVLYSRNMSLGINLLLDLVQRAATVLGEEYDVEIVEAHHNKKLDAPSGTALMLADAIRDVREESEYVYDRHSVRRERAPEEIGIHSVRGGTIVGEHEVIFAGTDEVIRISHSAYSRDVFATGAVRAALFAADAKPGMYSMKEMLAAEKGE